MYYRFPEYASNGSNMSAFLQNLRTAVLIGCAAVIIPDFAGIRLNTGVIIAIILAAGCMLYFTVKSFLAFRKDLLSGSAK
jgi:hypothetical protein